MNDNIYLDNYLLVLKSNVEVYNHGTLESSFEDIYKLLKECLNETIEAQRRTFNIMVDSNMYEVEKVNSNAIKKCLSKFNV